MTDLISEIRLALQTKGFSPIPVCGKRALLPNWPSKTNVRAAEITAWAIDYPSWANTGILTDKTPSFDIDIRQPEPACAVEELARDWFAERGTLLVRFGAPPKRAVLFRTATPFAKVVANFVAPDGSRHKLEVPGEGQQLVVNGIHPDTHKPY